MTLRNFVPSLARKRVPLRYDYSPFTMLNHDFDRLFDNLFRGFDMVPFRSISKIFTPHIELSENDREIKVSAELPGLDEKDVEVSLRDNTLTITGEKKEKKESEEKDYRMKERAYGAFRRSIPLGSEIDAKKVNAHFRKGVLTITLPKAGRDREKKKKISVKVE